MMSGAEATTSDTLIMLGENMETTMSRRVGLNRPKILLNNTFRFHKTKSEILESEEAKHKDESLETSQ